MNSKKSALVYSTDKGRISGSGGNSDIESRPPSRDQVIYLSRETKGRAGKAVSILSGFTLSNADLKTLCKELKQLCGTGGTVRERSIEIQGEHRDKLKLAIEAKGYSVKISRS